MPIQPTYPGVYVQEVPSGVRTIAGVSTSIAMFIGRTKWGPVNEPISCLNYTEFLRTFTDDISQGDMARAVRLFFINGGTRCYVNRIGANIDTALLTIQDGEGAPADSLTVSAKYPGDLGESIHLIITNSTTGVNGTFDLELYRDIAGIKTDNQKWTGLSMNPTNQKYAPTYVNYKWAVLTSNEIVPATVPPTFNQFAPDNTADTQLAGGSDGITPLTNNEYTAAYDVIDKEVDLFNLMIIPKDNSIDQEDVWALASEFCLRRRAFLLMDPREEWTTYQEATHVTDGVNSLRTSLVKDHSAVFFPRLTVNENGVTINVGPSGAIAGLMARTDSNRGVWKAPAGTEADLRGITGLEYRFSDSENGVMNPRGINIIRIFPNGIVNWGARTMDGDDDFASEYKYIPIRRTALFIEESLYRGLKWVVFEPNDEPLWAQVRLNVGAFMHNLFRQGAFQGTKKQDAYFVKCDSETTTQNDINLGIVNIWVGFAPLKPAEFVILYLQQMTGQIQV